MSSRARACAAGVVAAVAWIGYEPLGKRVFRTSYGDVELLEHLLPSRRSAELVHTLNGAAFALVYDALRRRLGRGGPGFGVALALAENTALWPLVALIDERDAKSPRAFASASAGHALFGAILGALA